MLVEVCRFRNLCVHVYGQDKSKIVEDFFVWDLWFVVFGSGKVVVDAGGGALVVDGSGVKLID